MFSANLSGQKKYWDRTWSDRIDGPTVKMNKGKMKFLLNEILKRDYSKANILEVGCGSGVHAQVLKTDWPDLKWTGIDLSELAVRRANSVGLNAFVGSIYDIQEGAFDAIWFLDVLEHIEDHKRLSAAVRKITVPGFRIFGNVPLYPNTAHDACERPMDKDILAEFLFNCGMNKFWQRIYGSFGYPYMVFEAREGE